MIIVENLREDISNIQEILRYEIKKIKDGEKLTDNGENQKFTEMLKQLKEFQLIVQSSRKRMLFPNVDTNIRKLCKKAEDEWRIIYPLITEYDKYVEEHNKSSKNKLRKISERIGIKLLPSIKTKHFNY